MPEPRRRETGLDDDLKVKDPRYTSLVAADNQILYAFDSLLAVAAAPEKFQQLYHGRFDKDGLLGEDIESKDAGPHTCTSPAIADGRLYLRVKQGIACYDLSKRVPTLGSRTNNSLPA